jgi:cytochrome c
MSIRGIRMRSSAAMMAIGFGLVGPMTGWSHVVGLAIPVLLLGTSASFGKEPAPIPPEQQGRALAGRMCAACHAVGRRGRSPHIGAPAFRQLDRRVDLDAFMDRLREGLVAGHPDMPMFRFGREDARAFVIYLRSIQGP